MANGDTVQAAKYSFLPWLRRGVAGLAVADGVPASAPVTVSLTLNVAGEGEASQPLRQQVRLYGPGDIHGLDARAVVRTIPRRDVKNFEANFLCGIEFYDEDFPWRYSPAVPAAGKLAAWIWLVVLRDDEFERHPATDLAAPSIEISGDAMMVAFPDPHTAASWAHTHLSFEVTGPTPEARQQLVTDTLDGNPNLGCSRLLSPRRLSPSTGYTAFLVPAYEKGRLAGLGKEDAAIAAATNDQASWIAGSLEARQFPVYFEWSFRTQTAGDFQSLANLLKPLSNAEEHALLASGKTVDIHEPGWGLHYSVADADNGRFAALPLQSALRPVSQVPASITDSTAAPDRAFLTSMQALLNLNIASAAGNVPAALKNPFFADGNLSDDPIVLPPSYGSLYRDNTSAQAVAVNAAVPVKDWFNQLNLNPAFRIGAGQGVTVFQDEQDAYMDRAWDQLGQLPSTVKVMRRWSFTMEAAQSVFNKRINPVLQQNASIDSPKGLQTLSLFTPMFKALQLQSVLPVTYNSSFTKLVRTGGTIAKRLPAGKPVTGITFMVLVIPPPKDVFYNSVKTLADYLRSIQMSFLGLQNPEGVRKNTQLATAGFSSVGLCLQALAKIQDLLKPPVAVPVIIAKKLLVNTVDIAARLNPAVTIQAKLQSMLPAIIAAQIATNSVVPATAAPEFSDAMYLPLAERSSDYILPGLDQIPENRVALMETNPAFIEAYMVGLNHELSREYLWREFPAALDTTAFRQFWDIRNNLKATALPDNYKDILPIRNWGGTALGVHKPGASAAQLVILIRGDLLLKYPNTEIFLQQAQWTDPGKTRKPANDSASSLATAATVKYPVFSAKVDPDYIFLGFDITVAQALGNAMDPGFYFVLKERAGDIHFGLDNEIDPMGLDPSWASIAGEVPVESCINTHGNSFRTLPRFQGEQAHRIAGMLYQKPYMIFIHASRMINHS